MGCLEISFQKATPAHVAMLSRVRSLNNAAMDPNGWNAPGYWVCNEDAGYSNINNMCPSTLTVDLHNGATGCGEDVTTMQDMISNMKTANSQKMWLFRILGFLTFYCAISGFLQPIRSMLAFVSNAVDTAVAWIPCIPRFVVQGVDLLTDMFMGVVKCVLFIVSCFFSSGCFLSVVLIMWIVMRPIMGLLLSAVVCACWLGGGAILYRNRKPNSRRKSAREPLVSAVEMPDAHYVFTDAASALPFIAATPTAPIQPAVQAALVLQPMSVICPDGMTAGGALTIMNQSGQQFQITVPEGVFAGQQFIVQVPA